MIRGLTWPWSLKQSPESAKYETTQDKQTFVFVVVVRVRGELEGRGGKS